jgi:hypothetical protein
MGHGYLGLLLVGLPLGLALSCASLDKAPVTVRTRQSVADVTESPRIRVIPSTLKILRDARVEPPGKTAISLDAAKGEGECAQILLSAGAQPLRDLSLEATVLACPEGRSIEAELRLVGYVRVSRPSFVGAHRRGLWPDPLLPLASFDMPAGSNQSIWYTVTVPRDSPAGTYTGRIRLLLGGIVAGEIPVELRVHEVTLPLTSALKTSVKFRMENNRDERWYGDFWSPEREEALPLLGLEFRFSTPLRLPLAEVFREGPGGALAADWSAFDAKIDYWLGKGISSFELDPGIRWGDSPDAIRERYGPRLAAIDAHMAAKGWLDIVHFYFYDEPAADEMPELRARLEAIRSQAPNIRNVLTYGPTMAGQRRLLGLVGTWVPNIHQYDPAFAASRRKLGEETWVYTCVANAFRPYPDNFRVDWHGAAHRALGWWLWKEGADGYLYWAVDLWRRDPWKDAATFPWTNGDGMLFYPPPDPSSAPWPSIRAHLMRDAFEDYDLLAMLRERCEERGRFPEEARRLLDAEGIILAPARFSKDDNDYIEAHRRLLLLLSGGF